MKKIFFALFFFGIILQIYSQNVVFVKENNIYLKDLKANEEKFVTKGTNPDLSYNNKFIVYTKINEDYTRSIAIYDIDNKSNRILDEIASTQNMNPVWSKDGSKIIFNTLVGEKWEIALINSDGSECKVLTNDIESEKGIFVGSWFPNGKSLLGYDEKNIYRISTEAEILETISLNEIVGDNAYSSDLDIKVAPNERYFTLKVLSDKDYIEGYVYPPTVLYLYDIKNKEMKRITPEGMTVSAYNYYNSRTIIFSALTTETIRNGQDKIYKIDMDGKNLYPIIKIGHSPST